MFRIGRVNGQGGELERGKPFVRAEQVRWHGRQQKMAARPTRGADKPRVKPVVTLRRDVGKRATRANDTAVGGLEELAAVVGIHDERVLVRMHAVWRDQHRRIGRCVAATSVRSGLEELAGLKICAKVAPLSLERRIPLPKTPT